MIMRSILSVRCVVLVVLSLLSTITSQIPQASAENITTGTINEQPKSDIQIIKAPGHTIEGPQGKYVNPKGYTLVPGMEIVSVNGTNIYLPQGTTVKKAHGVIYYEDIGEYLSRKFYELEERLKNIEASQESIKKELNQLKHDIEENKKQTLSSS